MKETWLKGSKQVCEMQKKRYVTKPGGILNWLTINILQIWTRRKHTQLCWQSRLQKFTADLQSESGRKNCFRLARQIKGKRCHQCVLYEKCSRKLCV